MGDHLDAVLVGLGAIVVGAGWFVARRHGHGSTPEAHVPADSTRAVIDRTAEEEAHRALEERARLVERLAEVVGDLMADLGLSATLDRIVRISAELVGADGASFVQLDDQGPVITAVWGLPDHLLGFRYPTDQGIVYEVLARQAPVVVAEYATDPRRVDFLADVLSGLHTVVGIPTVVRGRALGVLYCLFAVPGRVVTEAEIEVLNLLAGHAGAALANAEVYEEVLRSHEHERAVFDSIADGVATVGPDGLVATWNRAAHAITGIPAARAVGRPVPFPVGWPGEPVEHEVSEGRWIESIATPLWASPQTVIAFRDITRQKELEEAKNVFLDTISHELKTPLTVIRGFAATLLGHRSSLSEEETRLALEAILRRAESLSALVDQILIGTRVEAGQLELVTEPFELFPVIRAAAARFENASAKHTLEVELPETSPVVLGEWRSVEKVAQQLIENAFKYSPDGGEVRVGAEVGEEEVTVAVTDQGIGLEEKDFEAVFTRFYQGDAGDSRRFGGVGLGLYVSRRLIEAMGGRVAARGVPGEGATFQFTLPLSGRQPPPASS